MSGQRKEAQQVIEYLQDPSIHAYVAPYNIAVIYAGLEEGMRHLHG
jgi:hypothetical protein